MQIDGFLMTRLKRVLPSKKLIQDLIEQPGNEQKRKWLNIPHPRAEDLKSVTKTSSPKGNNHSPESQHVIKYFG